MLLRALRDFNLGKLTADDTGIFLGLLNDIFPKTLESVPRAINLDFETYVLSISRIRASTVSIMRVADDIELSLLVRSRRQPKSWAISRTTHSA